MRHVYLIRHCRPEFQNGQECCISRTDYRLSNEGMIQAEQLKRYFSSLSISAVYCSNLIRAVQTAEAIAHPSMRVIQDEGLREIDCGKWEGLTFAEIKLKYPEQYALRGTDPVRYFPDQGECLSDGLSRFQSAVNNIIDRSTGDIVIVAHSSVNRLLLCALLHRELKEVYTIPQPYGCINEITLDQDLLNVNQIGRLPEEFPDEEMIRYLWERYQTPQNVIAHCRAVTGKAVMLTRALAKSGYFLNEKLIYSAAMLHDIAHVKPDHAVQGAHWIAKEGYEKVAGVIACHHDLNENDNVPVTEKTVVFLADKLISEDREVTIEERFSKSAAKCHTSEAKTSHKRKYDQAMAAERRVRGLINKENLNEAAF